MRPKMPPRSRDHLPVDVEILGLGVERAGEDQRGVAADLDRGRGDADAVLTRPEDVRHEVGCVRRTRPGDGAAPGRSRLDDLAANGPGGASRGGRIGAGRRRRGVGGRQGGRRTLLGGGQLLRPGRPRARRSEHQCRHRQYQPFHAIPFPSPVPWGFRHRNNQPLLACPTYHANTLWIPQQRRLRRGDRDEVIGAAAAADAGEALGGDGGEQGGAVVTDRRRRPPRAFQREAFERAAAIGERKGE